MPVVRSRGATKKLGPVNKFVKFKVGKRQFSVHEDLICSSSELCETLLQSNRKKVEGNCSICHEPMDAETGDITFCRKACGQNFHEKCHEDWKQRQNTCPMCRAAWDETQEDLTIGLQHLSSTAVQQYVDWLYSRGAAKCLDDNEDLTDPAQQRQFFTKALQLHTVSEEMQDSEFIDNTARSIAIAWNKIAPVRVLPERLFRGDQFRPFINSICKNKTISEFSRAFFFRGLVPNFTDMLDFLLLLDNPRAARGIAEAALNMLHERFNPSLGDAYPEYLNSDDNENHENTESEDDQVDQESDTDMSDEIEE